jgi:hypothetical protein
MALFPNSEKGQDYNKNSRRNKLILRNPNSTPQTRAGACHFGKAAGL